MTGGGRPLVLIAAAGTAGHVVPALAVAAALRAEGARVEFVGGDRAEAQLVPAAGHTLHRIDVEGVSRTNAWHAVRALLRAARATAAAWALIGRVAPDVVLGGGGYVTAPVGLAALLRRVPLVLTEADSHLGLANRLLAPFAARVCLAFDPSRPRRRAVVTGRPVPSPAQPLSREVVRERLGIDLGAPCVLVFGGSLGARSINLATIEAFADSPLTIVHVTGRRDHAELAARPRPPRYRLHELLDTETFGIALAAADLVVARAGGSIFEIAAAGRPAILVPYPHATGYHQAANARWMARAGAAVVIEDAELDAARLAREVEGLLGDAPRLAAMARASASLARPDAAAAVAAQVLDAARVS